MKSLKIIAILAGGALVAASAAGAGWYRWSHSPLYSLKQIGAALEHHDRYEFDKYVDVDGILQSLVIDAAEGNAFAAAIGGAVVGNLKPVITKAVEDGSVQATISLRRASRNIGPVSLHRRSPCKVETRSSRFRFPRPVARRSRSAFTSPRCPTATGASTDLRT